MKLYSEIMSIKNIMIAAALLTSVSAGAQRLEANKAYHQFEKSNLVSNTRKAAPRRVAAGQIAIGTVKEGDNLFALNIGGGSKRVCSLVDAALLQKYAGCQVVGCRFAVGDAGLTGVRAWLSADPSNATLKDLCTATPETLVSGWNEVTFATPYTITGAADEELYLGYDFTATDSQRSALLAEVKSNYGFLLCESGRWYDYSSYGSLAVQLVLEGSNLPEYDIALVNFSTDARYYKSDAENIRFYTEIVSNGTKEIPGCNINILVDDAPVGTLQIEDTVATSTSFMYELPMKDLNLSMGKHTLGLAVASLGHDKVISEGTADDDAVVTTLAVYENASTRAKSVLEIYANQYSYLDPMQLSAVETLLKTRSDIIPVVIHGDFYGDAVSEDIFATQEGLLYGDAFGLASTPSLAINRAVLPGSAAMLQEISMQTLQADYLGAMTDYINENFPAFANVDVQAAYNADSRQLTITVNGTRGQDFANIFGKGALTVYLTEDGITALQENDEDTDPAYVHNHILRQVVTDVMGDEISWSGLRFSKTYTVNVPWGWNLPHMHAIAFIAKAVNQTSTLDDLDITNAAIADLAAVIPAGISETATRSHDDLPTYDLSGRRVDTPSRPGLYLRTGKKIVIK